MDVAAATAPTTPALAAPASTKRNRDVALTGFALTSLALGTVAGAARGNPLVGAAVGAAVAAVGIGAALLGGASSSESDGYCSGWDSSDIDCGYRGPTIVIRPTFPDNYPTPDYSYPSPGYSTPPSYGDTYYPPSGGYGGDYPSGGDFGGGYPSTGDYP